MKRFIPFLIAAAFSVSAVMAKDDVPREEVDIQGTWQLVTLESRGEKAPEEAVKGTKLLIKGDKLALSGKEGDLRRYRLDAAANPKTMDIPVGGNVESGEEHRLCKGIYEVDGDTLRLCFSQSTADERPKSFDTKGTTYFCFTFKLVKVKEKE